MRIDENRLELTRVLYCLLIDYWHDVDTNWGRNAPDYYTPDGQFVGPAAAYIGREKYVPSTLGGRNVAIERSCIRSRILRHFSMAAPTRQPAIGL